MRRNRMRMVIAFLADAACMPVCMTMQLPVPAGSHNKARDSINLCCQLKVERFGLVSC